MARGDDSLTSGMCSSVHLQSRASEYLDSLAVAISGMVVM